MSIIDASDGRSDHPAPCFVLVKHGILLEQANRPFALPTRSWRCALCRIGGAMPSRRHHGDDRLVVAVQDCVALAALDQPAIDWERGHACNDE